MCRAKSKYLRSLLTRHKEHSSSIACSVETSVCIQCFDLQVQINVNHTFDPYSRHIQKYNHVTKTVPEWPDPAGDAIHPVLERESSGSQDYTGLWF